jgi:uroporphyrinogen-III synthase
MPEQALQGRTVAVPESRELDVFSAMLERRGAVVLRCPLVAILDAPDSQPVLAWIRWFIGDEHPCEDLILLTGEGLRRLLSCIDRHAPELRADFVLRLGRVRKITRGPKPARVLRELGLKPDIMAQAPTTAGVIASLQAEPLAGRIVGVQLYGTEPNRPLMAFLEAAGAQARSVAPYVYANQSDAAEVHALLECMAAGGVDAIAFTSVAQVERLFAIGPAELVRAALRRTEVAAIGPVVADALARHEVDVDLMPRESFFMKPLTSVMAAAFQGREDSESESAV